MVYYSVRHHTRYRYTQPVGESVMELRMQPRSDEWQSCLSFELKIVPPARLTSYTDYLQNVIHFFDIPRRHGQLVMRAEAQVAVQTPAELPEVLDLGAWNAVDQIGAFGEHWDDLAPSHFAHTTGHLATLADEFQLDRRHDPLTAVRHINTGIYYTFRYVPDSTTVDSPIDVALQSRQGVCQDYAHIMIALVRKMGIPCRYVSGYLFHRKDAHDQSADDASHAWVEAFLPDLGWVGFDPTNNILTGERHIRVAVGRDYADVPPTRGVFKGSAESTIDVGVQVVRLDKPEPERELLTFVESEPVVDLTFQQMMVQQQQQQ
jgi:transglutaminase-like putative cysteine protease